MPKRAGSSVRIEHQPPKLLSDIDLDWTEFKTWMFNKYSRSSATTFYAYAKKYQNLLVNIRGIDNLPITIKSNVVKSLIILSKFLGLHQQFKKRLLDYGVKMHRQDSFTSFLRILNTNNNGNDVIKWLKEVYPILNDNENIFLRFCLYSGLRKSEAIVSFNRIIELNSKGLLNEYYNKDLNCLQHFKYKDFIRKTKNCFITFITEDLLKQICNSQTVSYNALRIRLNRNNVKCRINELRDYYGTYLLQHGILEPEINLLQGRIPPSIFIKHYWSPKLSELRDRIFKALTELEQTID